MIHTLKHLAYTLKIDVTEFEKIIGKIDDYYYESKEPKLKDGKPRLNKNGEIEYRIIHPSKGRLKEIQKRINTNILKNIPTHSLIVVGIGSVVDRTGGKIDFGVPFKAVISMNVESWQADECPICKQGTIPLVKPGSRKLPTK